MSTPREGRVAAPRRRRSARGRAVALLVVLGALALTLALPIREWVSQRMEISRLEASVAATQQGVVDLATEQERWQDPAYVAAQARSRLHFVLPGEIGYVVIGANDTPVATAATGEEQSWWSGLWDSVRVADAG
ncbi:MAG: septum formation initiator family protein [Thermoleophilia bacterium]|nr:septum formation initiator family protein [Thermoleophilia bacterium]